MRRTKLNFDKFDWTNLFEMAAVGILLAGGFPVRSVGQQQGQKKFPSPENASNALFTAAQSNDEGAMLDISDRAESKSSPREMKPRTPTAALILFSVTRKCAAWSKSRMEVLFCISARRIGPRPYRS